MSSPRSFLISQKPDSVVIPLAMAKSAFGWQQACVCLTIVVSMSSNAILVVPGVLGIRSNLELNFTVSSSKATAEFQGLIPALVVFGDSTVDAGNNNYLLTIARADFAPYGMNFDGGMPTGRFTDGLLATDFISLKVGIPLQLPYLSPNAHGEAILSGINFASSSSGWFKNTNSLWNVKGIATQLQWYQNWKAEVLRVAQPEKGNYIIGSALYVISTGTNDWVNNYYLDPHLQKQYTPDQYTTMLLGLVRGYLQELYTLGGRNIAILSLLPMGCIPEQITLHLGNQGCVKSLNDIAIGFNKQFQGMLEDMKKTMPGSRLILFDIYPLFYNAIQNPQKYGFKYARTGCCGTGDLEVSYLCNRAVPTCSNPDEHIFWDSFHPTSHFYSLLTDDFFRVANPILLGPPNP